MLFGVRCLSRIIVSRWAMRVLGKRAEGCCVKDVSTSSWIGDAMNGDELLRRGLALRFATELFRLLEARLSLWKEPREEERDACW